MEEWRIGGLYQDGGGHGLHHRCAARERREALRPVMGVLGSHGRMSPVGRTGRHVAAHDHDLRPQEGQHAEDDE
jgi:hypothetical protein